MKTQPATKLKQSLKAVACVFAIVVTTNHAFAQLSTDQNFAYSDRKKMQVSVSITPSTKEFKAGIIKFDSVHTKLRVWVCNGEERKCTVAISSSSGIFWNTSFNDTYYNQVYDLSSLDDGEYKIEISDGRKHFGRTLLINSSSYVVRDITLH